MVLLSREARIGTASVAGIILIVSATLLLWPSDPASPQVVDAMRDGVLLEQLRKAASDAVAATTPPGIIDNNGFESATSIDTAIPPSAPPAIVYEGCFIVDPNARVLTHEGTLEESGSLTPSTCAAFCASEGYPHLEVVAPSQCWCGEQPYPAAQKAPEAECKRTCPGDGSLQCGGSWRASVYRLRDPVKPPLTFFIEPAKNRNSFFLSGRVRRWASGRYAYRLVVLNHRLTSDVDSFRREMCLHTPGMKVFVGHGELLLRNWPGNAVMLITGDEAGDWGLVRNNKYYGLHGPDSLLPSNETHPLRHIIMPPFARPWFRQYFDSRQTVAFGNDSRFFPLGPRHEFPDQDASVPLLPASKRRYAYMFIAAATDPSRQRLHDLLAADNSIPLESRFLHLAPKWQPNANSGDYVAPDRYAQIMRDSVFALCPKGHSIDQFRLYEAMESGTIPVIENKGGYLVHKLPPEYLTSPMLFVDEWDDAARVIARLISDKAAIDQRQQELKEWYANFMRTKLREMEDAAHNTLSRPDSEAHRTCAPYRTQA